MVTDDSEEVKQHAYNCIPLEDGGLSFDRAE